MSKRNGVGRPKKTDKGDWSDKMKCICGETFLRSNQSRHRNSKTHQEFVKKEDRLKKRQDKQIDSEIEKKKKLAKNKVKFIDEEALKKINEKKINEKKTIKNKIENKPIKLIEEDIDYESPMSFSSDEDIVDDHQEERQNSSKLTEMIMELRNITEKMDYSLTEINENNISMRNMILEIGDNTLRIEQVLSAFLNQQANNNITS